jgi:predicted DNA-binding transcriptional regulator YafY
MPINRNTIVRYKTIDKLLRKGRRHTLDEIIDACSDALYDINGTASVSRRTIQNDSQEMRYSMALGYYAPIVVVEKKYYTYSDPDYTITDIALSDEDVFKLTEAVDMIKQMTSFQGLGDVEDVVNRLEDYVASMRHNVEPVILLENNEKLKGLEFITPLHAAIARKQVIEMAYKTFKSRFPYTFFFSPYILKEYRNRWFVLGKRHDDSRWPVVTLALDRIMNIVKAPKEEMYQTEERFKPKEYFDSMVGVTRELDSPVEHVVFRVEAANVPYIITKPIHHSQQIVSRCKEDRSAIFSIDVILNYELEREFLGNAETVTVLEPLHLVEKLRERIRLMKNNYKLDDNL